MERVANVARSFEEAEQWDREQCWAMTADERQACARALKERYYGTDCPDVREYERSR